MDSSVIVFNASNLQGGGAVQVAASLVAELGQMPLKSRITIVLSSAVARECAASNIALDGFNDIHVIDAFGFTFFNRNLCKIFRQAHVVFTVFGPLYLFCRPRKSVVGFAQPWILYPSSEAYLALPTVKRMITRLKYIVQKRFFRTQSDLMVVEAEHARTRLATLLPKVDAVVVPNALNGVFLNAVHAEKSKDPARAACATRSGGRHLTLGHVGRAYSHKNLSILPEVRDALWTRHGIKATIRTTLNEAEWNGQSEVFRSSIENVGALSLQDCISFYQSIDGVIFPSLLESFSASPLEAMGMRLPLFASDRAFVRDFCDDIPFYFDPLDPFDIADAVARCFNMVPEDLATRLDQGLKHVLAQPTAKDRAKRIAEILTSFTPEGAGVENIDYTRREP